MFVLLLYCVTISDYYVIEMSTGLFKVCFPLGSPESRVWSGGLHAHALVKKVGWGAEEGGREGGGPTSTCVSTLTVKRDGLFNLTERFLKSFVICISGKCFHGRKREGFIQWVQYFIIQRFVPRDVNRPTLGAVCAFGGEQGFWAAWTRSPQGRSWEVAGEGLKWSEPPQTGLQEGDPEREAVGQDWCTSVYCTFQSLL